MEPLKLLHISNVRNAHKVHTLTLLAEEEEMRNEDTGRDGAYKRAALMVTSVTKGGTHIHINHTCIVPFSGPDDPFKGA
jgi:hypothetical protein